MKQFNRVYYPLMFLTSGMALILAVIRESTPIAIMGCAFLLATELERTTDAVRHINPQREQEPPSKPLFKAKPKPTEEEVRHEKLMANIDAYGGSGKGQVKI